MLGKSSGRYWLVPITAAQSFGKISYVFETSVTGEPPAAVSVVEVSRLVMNRDVYALVVKYVLV